MVKASCCMRADQQFSKVGLAEHEAECADGLFQYLPAVGDEQYTSLAVRAQVEPLEIKSRNHRLACPCGCNNKVLPSIMNASLDGQRIKNTLLKGVRRHVHQHRSDT